MEGAGRGVRLESAVKLAEEALEPAGAVSGGCRCCKRQRRLVRGRWWQRGRRRQ